MRARRVRPTLGPLRRSPLCDAVARVLLVALLATSVPLDVLVAGPRAARAQVPPAGAGAGALPTLYVNADPGLACNGKTPCFARIQSAIDAVGPGQRIVLQSGSYAERLRFRRINAASTSEADRIVVEADPQAPVGSVVLRGRSARCEGGYAVDFDRSRFVTLRGLSIVNGGVRGIGLRGGSRENRAIRLERLRLARGGPRECTGGIDVGRGNPQTVIANSLIYGNGRNGIRFRDGRGGSYYVVGNTIARNAWSGVQVAHASVLELVDNVIVGNGVAPGAAEKRVGVRRARTRPAPESQVRLLGNLVCGNVGGELFGPLLDPSDLGNLTPSGSEGPGIAASAACGDFATLFRDADGADDRADTSDDDFHLAAGSPAIDAGVDPRTLGFPVTADVVEADHDDASARPRDGNRDGSAAFDAGAHESAGDVLPTPTRTSTTTPSPTPTVTPSPSPSPSATPTPTGVPTLVPTSTPTATPTATPTPTVAVTATPTPTVRPGNVPPVARANGYAVRADLALTVAAPGVLGNDDDADLDPLHAVKLSDPLLGSVAFSTDGSFSYTPDPQRLVCPDGQERSGPSFVQSLSTSFAPPDNAGTSGLARGDFDRDGRLDVAFTWFAPYPGGTATYVSIMLGNGDGTFQTPVLLKSFFPPFEGLGALVARDFDRDGKLDLIAAQPSPAALLFFKGNGDGTFAADTSVAPGHRARALQVGDLDGDQILDLVSISYDDDQVAVLRGNGDGTFAAPVPYAVFDGPWDGAIGDVNGDGAPDLVLGFNNGITNRVEALLNKNDGSGALLPPVGFNPRIAVTGILLGNFDGDPALDLALAGPRDGDAFLPGFGPGAMVFVHGNGDGTFVQPLNTNFAGLDSDFPMRLFSDGVAEDLDGDGRADVAFVSQNGSQSVNAIFVGLGNGDGSFATSRYALSPGPAPAGSVQPLGENVDGVGGLAVASGDFDGDGLLDLVTSSGTAGAREGGLSLLLADAPGVFHSPRSVKLPVGSEAGGCGTCVTGAIALGDFVKGGKPELVSIGTGLNVASLVDGGLGLPAEVSLNDISGAGEFFAPVIRTGDFDRDGSVDVVYLGTAGAQGGPPPRVIVGWGDGAGKFTSPTIMNDPGNGVQEVAVADFDRDGFDDLAVYSGLGPDRGGNVPARVDVYRSDGVARTFSSLGIAGGVTLGTAYRNQAGLIAADFDHDDLTDIVVSRGIDGPGGSDPQQTFFIKGNGDGTFAPAVQIGAVTGTTEGIADFAVGDLNHDTHLDLVGTGFNTVWVQLGRGNGTFDPVVGYGALMGRFTKVALADLDRDGHLDVATIGNGGGPVGFSVLPGKGDGTFDDGAGARKFALGSTVPVALAIADLNDDGKSDLIIQHNAQHGWHYALMINDSEPQFGCTSTDSFTYQAHDGSDPSNATTVRIDVLPVNHPPVITSTPGTSALAGALYTYPVTAVDQDAGDVLAFALVEPPSGMTIDPDTGLLRWIPASNQSGPASVTVRVHDSGGLFVDQSYQITVRASVLVPDVVGDARAAAESTIAGTGLTVGAVTTRSSTTVPAGDVISQTPLAGSRVAQGSAVNLVVSTGPPGPGETLASIVIAPSADAARVGETRPFRATGIYANGAAADLTLEVAWASGVTATATISAGGIASALAPGSTTISASADGLTGTAQLSVVATVGGDGTDPTAIISSPAANTEVTAAVQITGTATDDNFVRYELDVAPAEDNASFTRLATGVAPVTAGVLGTLDPTLLLNGPYTVRLRVYDAGGNVAEASVGYLVTGARKVGLFTLSYTDLSVAMSGLPITVTRTYDSRDKGNGDFGVGWRLDVDTIRLRTNRVLGTAWTRQSAGIAVQLVPLDQHYVSLTLPDGKLEVFDLALSPTSQAFALDFTNVVGFTPRPGTLGKLEGLDNGSLMVVAGGTEDELWDDATFRTYDPRRFRYTTPGGQQMVIDRIAGVESVTDLNGNTLTIGAGGIVHSSGKSAAFTRDALGRITRIADPAGNEQTYAYDGAGNLIRHTSPVGDVTTYAYDQSHGLLEITGPGGTRVTRNEYDASGRLIATTDGEGHRIALTHDLGASQEIVKDRRGHQTVYAYDAAGNVLSRTDALGKTTTYTHDARGNQLSETDPLGRTASKTYDAADNVLTSIDFDGNTTTHTYNARRQVLTTTDPEGRTTSNVYDARGNLESTTDPEGGVTLNTYDAAGNKLTVKDPVGRTTTFTYDATGFRTSSTDPRGLVTTYGNDANGNPLTETRNGQVVEYTYDRNQRLDTTDNDLNLGTRTTYSPIGDGRKVASLRNAGGETTTYEYDALGNLEKTTFPDGTTRVSTFDPDGHEIARTDRDGHTTSFEYDALGRQTKMVHPDGTTFVTTYDDAGRVLTRTDERGYTTTHAYAPNRQIVTDALGNVTTHEFDGAGRLVEVTDALSHVTRFTNDSRGNRTATIFPDGTSTTTTYDVAGQKIAETDQAGRAVTFTYDLAGNLEAVTDAEGGVTTYGYDARGSRTSVTDANGHATTLVYDVLERLTARIRPLGQQETFGYDTNSNLATHTGFDGTVISYGYDADYRQTSKTLPGGIVVPYAYSGEGFRTQAGGDLYAYDDAGRMTTETKANGDVIGYGYDARGNRTSVTTSEDTTTYTYDELDRLSTVSDASGTTTYGYDAVGNLISTAYPNGVTTTYDHDDLNRLVQMTNTGPGGVLSSYTYTLGPAGNRLQVTEFGPATTGRVVTYGYDDVYRLVEESIDEPGAAADLVVKYTYDAVGNRTRMERGVVVTTYAYDANDRLVTETAGAVVTTSAYDDAGNLLTRTTGAAVDVFDYDAESRLIAADVDSGANPGPVTYAYDADGMRTASTAGGVTTTYLTDRSGALAQVLVERSGASVVTYAYGLDLVRQTRPGTGVRFYQYDGHLSTRQLTDASGAVTDAYTYDAFGVALASSGSSANAYRYAGEQLDPNVGFYYLRARYYDQASGRFTSTDPEGGSIYDPVSLHRYLYANADPVNNIDPSGRLTMTEISVVSALVGVLVGIAVYAYTKSITAAILAGVTAASITFFALYFLVGLTVGTEALTIRQSIEFSLRLRTPPPTLLNGSRIVVCGALAHFRRLSKIAPKELYQAAGTGLTAATSEAAAVLIAQQILPFLEAKAASLIIGCPKLIGNPTL